MTKISMKISVSFRETFDQFLLSRKAKGLAEKTITTYRQHLSVIGKHISLEAAIEDLSKTDLENMIASMRDAELAPNSIKSYTSTLKSFFSWCNEESITSINLPLYKAEETIKETYSDDDLMILLKKPNLRSCRFPEYRSWVIINLLINNGCRAATIRNIKIKDVDFSNKVIYLRHTKNKRSQVIPLCNDLCTIFREYLRIRGGSNEDFLFPSEDNGQMTENGLRCSIARYNKSRGVERTSTHMFRHTFAKKYLVDCGGNAFTLQKLLGHSTLDMTKHYCAIFDADIAKNYDEYSPLAKMKLSTGNKIKLPARKQRRF